MASGKGKPKTNVVELRMRKALVAKLEGLAKNRDMSFDKLIEEVLEIGLMGMRYPPQEPIDPWTNREDGSYSIMEQGRR